jgi:hypothetical protein
MQNAQPATFAFHRRCALLFGSILIFGINVARFKERKILAALDTAGRIKAQHAVYRAPKFVERSRFSVICGASLLLLILGPIQPGSIASAQGIQEIRVRWDAYLPGPPVKDGQSVREAASNVFTLLERRTFSGRVPRQRNPELTSHQIVVIARDANGRLVDWQLIPDPLVLRYEHPGPKGELGGQLLYRTSGELLITLPDDPNIKRIEVHRPRWTGTDFVLELMGAVPVS